MLRKPLPVRAVTFVLSYYDKDTPPDEYGRRAFWAEWVDEQGKAHAYLVHGNPRAALKELRAEGFKVEGDLTRDLDATE